MVVMEAAITVPADSEPFSDRPFPARRVAVRITPSRCSRPLLPRRSRRIRLSLSRFPPPRLRLLRQRLRPIAPSAAQFLRPARNSACNAAPSSMRRPIAPSAVPRCLPAPSSARSAERRVRKPCSISRKSPRTMRGFFFVTVRRCSIACWWVDAMADTAWSA